MQYEGFFKNNTRIPGSESLTGEALSEKAYEYVKTQVGTNGDAETAKTFAKDMLGWILDSANNITVTTTVNTTATSTVVPDLAYGYYLVYPKGATDTSTAPGNGNQTYTSAASLVNITADTATINMKSNYPTVDKKIIPAQSGSGIKLVLLWTAHGKATIRWSWMTRMILRTPSHHMVRRMKRKPEILELGIQSLIS